MSDSIQSIILPKPGEQDAFSKAKAALNEAFNMAAKDKRITIAQIHLRFFIFFKTREQIIGFAKDFQKNKGVNLGHLFRKKGTAVKIEYFEAAAREYVQDLANKQKGRKINHLVASTVLREIANNLSRKRNIQISQVGNEAAAKILTSINGEFPSPPIKHIVKDRKDLGKITHAEKLPAASIRNILRSQRRQIMGKGSLPHGLALNRRRR